MAVQHVNVGLYLATLVALLDQGSKWWVLGLFAEGERIRRVTSFLNLRLSWNEGVTFGLLSTFGEAMVYILIGAAILISLILVRWLMRSRSMLTSLGIGLVLGGAVGNVIDRVRIGAVVDFLDFHVGGYHWYTFNVADSAIVVGVGFLLLENWRETRHKR